MGYHTIGKQFSADDKCLFFVNGSWMYNNWESVNPENLINVMPTEFPVFAPIDLFSVGYSIMWAVPKKAPNKDEAVKFLLALNKSKFAEKWVRHTKFPTGIKGKLASISKGVDKFEDFTFHIISKYGGNVYPFTDNRYIFNEKLMCSNNYIYEVLS